MGSGRQIKPAMVDHEWQWRQQTEMITITTQNHDHTVDQDSLGKNVEVSHINLNDNTVEGMRHKEMPIFSIQYHPEAAPGPHDASYFFEQFVDLIEKQG